MNLINTQGLLVVVAAVVITIYLLGQAQQPPSQQSYETRDDACAQVGARNHSGVEPYDPFGFCHSEQGRDYYAGQGLPGEGRRR
jgi:hypothetical protein